MLLCLQLLLSAILFWRASLRWVLFPGVKDTPGSAWVQLEGLGILCWGQVRVQGFDPVAEKMVPCPSGRGAVCLRKEPYQ